MSVAPHSGDCSINHSLQFRIATRAVAATATAKAKTKPKATATKTVKHLHSVLRRMQLLAIVNASVA